MTTYIVVKGDGFHDAWESSGKDVIAEAKALEEQKGRKVSKIKNVRDAIRILRNRHDIDVERVDYSQTGY